MSSGKTLAFVALLTLAAHGAMADTVRYTDSSAWTSNLVGGAPTSVQNFDGLTTAANQSFVDGTGRYTDYGSGLDIAGVAYTDPDQLNPGHNSLSVFDGYDNHAYDLSTGAAIGGYFVTSGLSLVSGPLSLSFDTATTAFAARIGVDGPSIDDLTVTVWTGASSSMFNVPTWAFPGGDFLGFTASQAITRIDFAEAPGKNGGHFILLDDVSLGTALGPEGVAAPLPSTAWGGATLLAAFATLRTIRQHRRRPTAS